MRRIAIVTGVAAALAVSRPGEPMSAESTHPAAASDPVVLTVYSDYV